MDVFKARLERLYEELSNGLKPPEAGNLLSIVKLICKLWDRRAVKSNHSVMEIVCAWHLIRQGYKVQVEVDLENDLICDLYAIKDGDSLIVEIETGFVPPENAFDPLTYRLARILGKVARYCSYTDFFALATPPYHILQIPEFLVLDKEERSLRDGLRLKKIIDKYYKNPPVDLWDVMQSKVDFIYIVDVDQRQVYEFLPIEYFRKVLGCELSLMKTTPLKDAFLTYYSPSASTR